MIGVEIAQFRRDRFWVGAGQTGAAEHQLDPMQIHIGGDAAPQQLHGRTAPMLAPNARPAQFQLAAGVGQNFADVIFIGGVEMPKLFRRLFADQPICADNSVSPLPDLVIDHHKMVSHLIERIGITSAAGRLGTRASPHLLIKHLIAQTHRGLDLGLVGGHPHTEIAGPQFPKPGAQRQRGMT